MHIWILEQYIKKQWVPHLSYMFHKKKIAYQTYKQLNKLGRYKCRISKYIREDKI